MEDLLRVIFIIAIIGIAIVKGVNKSLKTAQPKNDVPPRPPLQPQAGGPSPLPEAWGGLNIPTNSPPAPQPRTSTMQQPVMTRQSSYKQPKKQKHRTGEVEAQAKAYRDPALNRNITSTPSSFVSSHNEEDFILRSAEEARRAIVWGEILQRKY